MIKVTLKFDTYYNEKKKLCTGVEITYDDNTECGTVSGIAILSHKDTDHRALGQKYALLNALKDIKNREVRIETWKVFHAHSKAIQKIVTYKDQKPNGVNPYIKVWFFHEAPKKYQELSQHSGNEDWLAFIPKIYMGQCISWLGSTGCNVQTINVEGGLIKIGAHA